MSFVGSPILLFLWGPPRQVVPFQQHDGAQDRFDDSSLLRGFTIKKPKLKTSHERARL